MTRILVVDDEAPMRRVISSILDAQGYDCTTAANAKEARALLKENEFELVLSDIRMPGESGLDLLREVIATYPDMATIVISGIDDLEVAEAAVNMGVYGYILKPLNRNMVLINVSNAFRRRHLEIANRLHEDRLSEMVRKRTAELQNANAVLKKTQAELQCKQKDHGLLIKNLPCVIYRGYADWTIDLLNGSLQELTGYTIEDMHKRGMNFSHLIHPKDLDGAKNATRKALKGDGSFVREFRIRTRNQKTVWLQDRGQVVCDDRGRIQYISGVFFDITAKKHIERDNIQAKKQWEATFDAVPDLIAIIDDQHRIQRLNRSMAERLGIRLEDAVGRHCYPLVHGTQCPIPSCPHTRTLADGREHHIEASIDSLGGHFLVSTSPLVDPNGKLMGSVHVARDITRQHQVAEKLRQAHTEIEQLIDSISAILIGVSPKGRIVRWNHSAEQVLGIPEAAAVGSLLAECPIPWQWDQVQPAVSACQREGLPQKLSNTSFCRPDGGEGFLTVSCNPVSNGNGASPGLLILANDITEQRILETQLSQAQKLESIGQLAAGIAHEINTPIQYVGDNLHFLHDAFSDISGFLEKLDDVLQASKSGPVAAEIIAEAEQSADNIDLGFLKEEIPVSIEQSQQGVQQVSQIVRSMKEFSHPGVKEKVVADLNKGLKNTVTVAKNEWKYVAEMEMDLDPDLPMVPCLPGEINQVFLNLIVNAAQAIGEQIPKDAEKKGTIRIVSRQVQNGVEICISDTGPGIPEEIRSRVFDPFFTTKEVGKGTGQGLAIAHSVIVDKHGGGMRVESEVGRGTTFIITLPFDPTGERDDEPIAQHSVRR